MLTITKVNYIRELYFLEGESYTEISRKTGYNYRTIKKYIEMEDFSPDYHKAKRPNKTDILRPIIFNWLTEDKSRHPKQRHTARRIYYRLKEEHPDLLQVSERRIRDIVREEKQKVFGKDSAYLKLEHPGGEAQVDFGTEILRQYFINHPQSIDKYTFLQNSAFTHWVKEKCSKMC